MAQRQWLLDQVGWTLAAGSSAAPPHDQPLGEPIYEYIVIDELEEGIAVLVIEPWPELDQRGRLHFPRSDLRLSIEVEVHSLERMLIERLPVGELTEEQRAAFATRPLRVGDVLCSVVDRPVLLESPDDIDGWLRRPVLDVTPQAREVAKAQYFAAVGPVLGPNEVEAIAEGFFADEEPA